MVIVTEFELEPSDTEFARYLGKSSDRVLKSERNKARYEVAKQELLELAKAAGAWKAFPVAGFEHDKIILENGTRIGGGPVVELTCGATELAVGISTIGPAVEQRAKQYIDAGDTFHAFLLDGMASWAAGAIRQQMVLHIRMDHYQPRNMRTSIPLGPGEAGTWSVDGQQEIFTLLGDDASSIGMQLEPSMLMAPLKSTSFIMGASTGPLGKEAGTQCEFCKMRNRCTHNRAGSGT